MPRLYYGLIEDELIEDSAIYEDELIEEPQRRETVISNIDRRKHYLPISWVRDE
jgi:hypothetical protein